MIARGVMLILHLCGHFEYVGPTHIHGIQQD